MKTNYHTHSRYCDGESELEEYAAYAAAHGFRALGFTGHAPLPFPNDWTTQDEDLPAYLNEVRHLKDSYKGSLEIYLGLEIDYIDEVNNATHPKYDAYGLDYRIGSVHYLYARHREKYLTVDKSKEQFSAILDYSYGGDIAALVRTYYGKLRSLISKGGFQILGHIDLIKKFNRGNTFFNENEPWYQDEIEKTLDELRGTDIILEMNTGAMAKGYTAEPYPSEWILRRAAEMNIPTMLNSDAHRPEWIDFHFTEADALIRSAGYAGRWIFIDNRWEELRYE